MIHGGDYNPDQWIRTPEIWDQDMRLMKLSGCNAASVCIFSWSALEPEEGQFEFGWLDTIMDKLAANDAFAVMATPSGSKPVWLSRSYPETCRVNADKRRQPHGGRHNHCRTSPAYREKCTIINTHLAERYRNHPALLLWHVSNEYNGEDCHCDLCYEAFQTWLRERYDHDLDKLNHAYWSSFWSHTFPDWEAVQPVDDGIHGLMLDWARFKTYQTIDFFKAESAPLRTITPDVPITTNFMIGSTTLDYGAFAKEVDVVSWDSYPFWHEGGVDGVWTPWDGSMNDQDEAAWAALKHDVCRSMKAGKPWMLMESVPSVPTRGRIKKRKNPGMHLLSSLQAIAHGSDSVQYFQWRKSRGSMEKFHGAVVDHVGHENTRVFRDVTEVGNALKKLDDVVGTTVKPEVALIFDWENEWALNTGGKVYLGENVKYRHVCRSHYRPFWEAGVSMDVIDQTCPLEPYKLVIVPMAYMLRPGFADRLTAFVAAGGTAVMTYWSAVVNESDLCFLGGIPGAGLRAVFGVWEEESQSYFPKEKIAVTMEPGNVLGLEGSYHAVDTCSVIHAEGADVLATYSDDFFAGQPAITVNAYGQGTAYYQAARMQGPFLAAFYNSLICRLNVKRVLDADLPAGVTAQRRTDGSQDFVFLMNFTTEEQTLTLPETFDDMLEEGKVAGTLTLPKYGVRILRRTPR